MANITINTGRRTLTHRRSNNRKESSAAINEVGPQCSGPGSISSTMEDIPDSREEQAVMNGVIQGGIEGAQHNGPEGTSRTAKDSSDSGEEQEAMDWMNRSSTEGIQRNGPEDSRWMIEDTPCSGEVQEDMNRESLGKTVEDGMHGRGRTVGRETTTTATIEAPRRN